MERLSAKNDETIRASEGATLLSVSSICMIMLIILSDQYYAPATEKNKNAMTYRINNFNYAVLYFRMIYKERACIPLE